MKWEHVPNKGSYQELDTKTASLHDPNHKGVPRRIGWGRQFTHTHGLHKYDTCRVYVKGKQVAVQFYENGEGDRKVVHGHRSKGGTSVNATAALVMLGATVGRYWTKQEHAGFVVIDLNREVTA